MPKAAGRSAAQPLHIMLQACRRAAMLLERLRCALHCTAVLCSALLCPWSERHTVSWMTTPAAGLQPVPWQIQLSSSASSCVHIWPTSSLLMFNKPPVPSAAHEP